MAANALLPLNGTVLLDVKVLQLLDLPRLMEPMQLLELMQLHALEVWYPVAQDATARVV